MHVIRIAGLGRIPSRKRSRGGGSRQRRPRPVKINWAKVFATLGIVLLCTGVVLTIIPYAKLEGSPKSLKILGPLCLGAGALTLLLVFCFWYTNSKKGGRRSKASSDHTDKETDPTAADPAAEHNGGGGGQDENQSKGPTFNLYVEDPVPVQSTPTRNYRTNGDTTVTSV